MIRWRHAVHARHLCSQNTVKRTIGRTPAESSKSPKFALLSPTNSFSQSVDLLNSLPAMKDDALLEHVTSALEGHKKSHSLLRALLTELQTRRNIAKSSGLCLKVMEQTVFSKARDPIIASFLSHCFLEHSHAWSTQEAFDIFTFSACFVNESGANYPDPTCVDFLVQRFWDPETGWNLETPNALKLLLSLIRINYADRTVESLAEYVSGNLQQLSIAEVTEFAWILQPKTFGNNLDIILIADLAKVAAQRMQDLDVTTIQLVLYNCSKESYYDEYFLTRASQRLQEPAVLQRCSQSCIAGLIQNIGSLQWRDPALGDALCDAVSSHANALTEHFAQKVIFGLMKMRHKNEKLFLTIAQNLQPTLKDFRDISLSRMLSAFSAFHVFDLEFHLALFNELVKRVHQLQPVSLQHLITGMQRFESDFVKHDKQAWLTDILNQTAEAITSRAEAKKGSPRTISPVQALAILMAFRKLQFRESRALSKIVGTFTVPASRRWPDDYRIFYPAHAWHQLPPCPFDVVKTKALWEELELTAAVQVIQGFSSLECWSAESLWLGLYLKYLVEDRLHDLKAKEILAFAESFKDWTLPDGAMTYATSVFNGKVSPTDVPPKFPPNGTWQSPLLSSCMENLRRHELFVSRTWWVLCRLKILDLGIRLLDASKVDFEDFRHRLCDMSIEDCQRVKEELTEEEGVEDVEPGVIDVPVWSPGPVEACGRWSVQENGAIDGFRVDVLFSRVA